MEENNSPVPPRVNLGFNLAPQEETDHLDSLCSPKTIIKTKDQKMNFDFSNVRVENQESLPLKAVARPRQNNLYTMDEQSNEETNAKKTISCLENYEHNAASSVLGENKCPAALGKSFDFGKPNRQFKPPVARQKLKGNLQIVQTSESLTFLVSETGEQPIDIINEESTHVQKQEDGYANDIDLQTTSNMSPLAFTQVRDEQQQEGLPSFTDQRLGTEISIKDQSQNQDGQNSQLSSQQLGWTDSPIREDENKRSINHIEEYRVQNALTAEKIRESSKSSILSESRKKGIFLQLVTNSNKNSIAQLHDEQGRQDQRLEAEFGLVAEGSSQEFERDVERSEEQNFKSPMPQTTSQGFLYSDPTPHHDNDVSRDSQNESQYGAEESQNQSASQKSDELIEETPALSKPEQTLKIVELKPPAAALPLPEEIDCEAALRKALDLPDAQIFDVHFILQILRRKYNKNYAFSLGQLKLKQKDEQRVPTPLAKVPSKLNYILRKIQPPRYQIPLAPAPREYPVKFEVDMHDPGNLAEGPPQTTAKSWSVYDLNKLAHVCTKNVDHKLEIASMTKIMTAYTCCRIMFGDWQQVNINTKKIYFRASYLAAKIGGTTAHIREGLRYSIYDLLMGLMLPSGNDASLVLAENFGRFISAESARISLTTLKEQIETDPYDEQSTKHWIARFVKRMNQEASKLKLVNTSFSNPHGLSDKANKSSAQDVVRLTMASLKYPLFQEIVKKYQHDSSSIFDWNMKRPIGEKAVLVQQQWRNLNFLLKDPKGRYKGVKTGHTPNAGSCLCTLYEDPKHKVKLMCVVIGTNTNKHRFQETTKLINWCIAQALKKQNPELFNQTQQGSSFASSLRTGSQSGQASKQTKNQSGQASITYPSPNLSSLAKVGNNVMMNMNNMSGQKSHYNIQAVMNQTGIPRASSFLPGVIESRKKTQTQTGRNEINYQQMGQSSYPIPQQLTSNNSVPIRPQSLTKIDRIRNINAIGVKRVGNLGFGVRFNPNFH